MSKRSKVVLICMLTAMLSAVASVCIFNMGWFKAAGSSLPKEEAALRYPYCQLSRSEQALYGALYRGIADYDETITLPGYYDRQTYERVYLLLAEQEPQFFYLDTVYETGDGMYAVKMHYDVPKEKIGTMKAEMELAADGILAHANAEKDDMQKLIAIHDGIAALCEYSEGDYQDEAYGCLVEGAAKCEGYAKAFLYVARRAGLHVMSVTGVDSKNENHVWNIAEYNGQYYNIDVTWDDNEQYRGNIAHICFALPDSRFGDHRADLSAYTPPACEDETLNYYSINGFLANSAAELPEAVRAWPLDTSLLEFRMADQKVYQDVVNMISTSEAVRDAVNSISGAQSYTALVDEGRNVIVILPS